MSESLPDAGPRINLPEFSVSELSASLRRTVEDAFPYVRVRGEISGYRGPHSSGHAYFALKDENAKLDAVCFKGVFQKLKFKPQEGMEAVATGRITTYPGKSGYQIIVESLEPAGAGALLALLEERKKKLTAEGLFAAERKKPLPYLPEVIGVVTSPTGAVIRDILHRLSDRFPRRVLLWPVTVQGEKAAGEIAAAIDGFNTLTGDGPIPRPDVLIVARGGGSIEDLWAFNEEVVVRAAAASAIPLISAVGHETDTTLIDFASDRRAPTPSAAAEMAVPVRSELLRAVATLSARHASAITRRVETLGQRVRDLGRALPQADRLLEGPGQRLDAAGARLAGGLTRVLERAGGRIATAAARLSPQPLLATVVRGRDRVNELHGRSRNALERRLQDQHRALQSAAKLMETLSHRATLARGFALVRDEDGRLLRQAAAARPGTGVTLEFADGGVAARIEGDAALTPKQKPKSAGKRAPKGQGDLF
jgi:exodeoxyribonuclease VII large subunit